MDKHEILVAYPNYIKNLSLLNFPLEGSTQNFMLIWDTWISKPELEFYEDSNSLVEQLTYWSEHRNKNRKTLIYTPGFTTA